MPGLAPGIFVGLPKACQSPVMARKISPKKSPEPMSDRSRLVRPRSEPLERSPLMAKMIFVNLPVSDLARATAFYQAIGAVKNDQFCDDTASCMVFSETIYAMLLTHEKFM